MRFSLKIVTFNLCGGPQKFVEKIKKKESKLFVPNQTPVNIGSMLLKKFPHFSWSAKNMWFSLKIVTFNLCGGPQKFVQKLSKKLSKLFVPNKTLINIGSILLKKNPHFLWSAKNMRFSLKIATFNLRGGPQNVLQKF